jgi:hypothetical protein
MQLDLRSFPAKFLPWVKDFPNRSSYPGTVLLQGLQGNPAEGEMTRDENGLQQDRDDR